MDFSVVVFLSLGLIFVAQAGLRAAAKRNGREPFGGRMPWKPDPKFVSERANRWVSFSRYTFVAAWLFILAGCALIFPTDGSDLAYAVYFAGILCIALRVVIGEGVAAYIDRADDFTAQAA